MTEDSDDALDALMEEALARRRRGEDVSVADLEAAHPAMAARIRRLFPMLLAMEGLAVPRGAVASSSGLPPTAGRYRLGKHLGSGGMGRVFEAVAEEGAAAPAGSRVAVKLLHAHLIADPHRRERFLREAALGRKVVNPHVVRTLDSGSYVVAGEEHPYLVQEHVEGRTLRALIDETGALPERLVRHIGLSVARGLAAVHAAGAVHRDVKPENVMLTDREDVKLMDLGVASIGDRGWDLSATGEFVGTRLYAAPEQLAGGATDARTDLFALGLTLHEALLGRHVPPAPGLGGDPTSLPAQTSPLMHALVRRLLAVEPSFRIQSASEVVEILAAGESSNWWRSELSEGSGPNPLMGWDPIRSAPLRGREDELALLNQAWLRLRDGKGSVIWVEGDLGIGKSHLLRTWAARTVEESRGGARLRFVCVRPARPGDGVPPLAAAMARHISREGLEAYLAHALGEGAPLAPRLAAVLRGEDPQALPPQALGHALGCLGGALAAEGPLVIVAEDMQDATPDDVAALLPLAHAALSRPILVLVASRPLGAGAPAAALARLPGLRTLRLSGISAEAAIAVLHDDFGKTPEEGTAPSEMVARCEGNPLFLLALAGYVPPAGGQAPTRLPDTLSTLLAERIARVTGPERALLEMAACAGDRFDPALVADAEGKPLLFVLQALARVEADAGLLASDGSNLTFRPRLAQEALRAAMSAERHATCHLALGAALEAQIPPDGASPRVLGDRSTRLARHFVASGRLERSAPHLALALETLADRDLYHDFHVLLSDVGGLPGLRRLLPPRDLAKALWHVAFSVKTGSPHPEALACARECAAVAEAAGDIDRRSRAIVLLGSILRERGRSEEALPLHLEALREAEKDPSGRAEARARAGIAYTLAKLGRRAEAITEGRRARALALRTGEEHLAMQIAGHFSKELAACGQLVEAEALIEEYLAYSRRLGPNDIEGSVLISLSALQRAQSRFVEAERSLRRAIDFLAPRDHTKGHAAALGALGPVLIAMGRYPEARSCAEEALVRGQRFPMAVCGSHLQLAFVCHACADGVGEEAHLLAAEQIAVGGGEALVLHTIQLLRAKDAVHRGDAAAAADHVARSRTLVPNPELRAVVFETLVLGESAEARGDLTMAERTYEAAIARCDAESWAEALGSLRLARGRVRAAQHRKDLAAADFDVAVQWARSSSAEGVLVVALARRASLGGDLTVARLALERGSDRCTVRQRYEARHVLGILLDDPAMRAAALEDARSLGAPRPPWATAADPVEAGDHTR